MKKPPTYYDQVFAVTRRIPLGRVTNYGAIADFLALGSARMVGWALRQSFAEADIPAHRVVNRLGELSGRHHFPTPTAMEEALVREGHTVQNDRILNFEAAFWHPSEDLDVEEVDALFD